MQNVFRFPNKNHTLDFVFSSFLMVARTLPWLRMGLTSVGAAINMAVMTSGAIKHLDVACKTFLDS